ncbi:MAG: hypothetical protein CDV28_1297 [Candidatus Electronema aureum]|uniref:Uncharacterized protein n=1 Tax=Candidatus Electronema aureum TaxID=2005002 RepID=A0A521FZZ6_9BACT|nr:MAG: hypothetical protein CDV28_1297 [Candidatus Electronema aureum]
MNPFKILNIGPEASAQEIMQAAALALREKQHSAYEIAEARRQLMDPSARPVLAFIYFADLEPLLRQPVRGEKPLSADALKRLEIFD